MNKPFSLLIKPTSADCNLNCDYCFYLKKSSLYPERKNHRMSIETLEQLISSFMKTTQQQQYSFGWQGGEPTMMGIDFFKKAIYFQQKYGRSGLEVGNGLQTNALLINDEFAAFFAKYNFLLGVSLDGPERIHDKYRLFNNGTGSQKKVLNSINILNKHKVEFNILAMANSETVKNTKDIYNYFKENNFNFLQYIPCVEFDSNNQLLPFAITGEEWGEFLCDLFDEWYKDDTRKVSIRLFDSILVKLVDGIANICHFGKDCRQYFVVEHNGDIYPCDFFVNKEVQLGNIKNDTWNDLLTSDTYKEFGTQKCQWSAKCAQCRHRDICAGDCLKHRIYGTNTDPRNLSHLCKGWEMFFDHTRNRFTTLANQIIEDRKQEQQAAMQQRIQQQMQQQQMQGDISRNSKCPCGSGKRYKACCMKSRKAK